jgi:hypothetical protein
MTRLEANRELLKILTEAVEKFPDGRFGQILSMLRMVTHTRPVSQKTADSYQVEWKDEFYLESKELLTRVKTTFRTDYHEE